MGTITFSLISFIINGSKRALYLLKKVVSISAHLPQVESCTFPIHRNIMSACSPYFRALFTNTSFETNQREVTVTGVTPQIMMLIIDYAYTRSTKVSSRLLLALVYRPRVKQGGAMKVHRKVSVITW